MRPRLALLLCVLAVGAAACGGDGGGEGGVSSEGCPSGAVVIRMVDIKFDPKEATARAGQEICWVNEDEIDHNAVARSGATFTATVEQPGTVDYVCTVHPGMVGTIEVEG
jgi:plastocyanin